MYGHFVILARAPVSASAEFSKMFEKFTGDGGTFRMNCLPTVGVASYNVSALLMEEYIAGKMEALADVIRKKGLSTEIIDDLRDIFRLW
jgi:hypothetical protein